VGWVRERTIPTERPPLVGEVSANFCEYRVPHGQRDGFPRPYSGFSRPEPLIFLPSSFSVVLTRLSGPSSRPTTSQKIWQGRESNLDLWISSMELWPLDHRGGLTFTNLNPFFRQAFTSSRNSEAITFCELPWISLNTWPKPAWLHSFMSQRRYEITTWRSLQADETQQVEQLRETPASTTVGPASGEVPAWRLALHLICTCMQ
jgi:hypothetical protein